ncbi:MAG: hypothetical protein AB1486_10550 [Planctomycetota bacterium]
MRSVLSVLGLGIVASLAVVTKTAPSTAESEWTRCLEMNPACFDYMKDIRVR